MSDTITYVNPQTQEQKKKTSFIIPAILILPDLIYAVAVNIRGLYSTIEAQAPEISAQSYKMYVGIVNGSKIAALALAVMTLLFFIGCICKTADKNYKPFLNAYFAKEIVYGVAMVAMQTLQTVYNYKWILEEYGAENAVGLQASIVPQALVACVMYLPVTVVGILLLAAEKKDSCSLRKALRVLMVVNIVFCAVMFVAILLSQNNVGMLRPFTIAASSIALFVYQSNSIKMCKAEA